MRKKIIMRGVLYVISLCLCLIAVVALVREGEWQQLSSAPAELLPRFGQAMVYDSARQELLLFGGVVYNRTLLDDTWVYSKIGWERKSPANKPCPRANLGVAYDSLRKEVVLFGGDARLANYMGDTWVWDGSNWTEKAPASNTPAPRERTTMVFDEARGEIVLFGGAQYSVAFNDTWVWNGTSWSERYPNSIPGARGFHSMAYDSANQEVVLFGGFNEGTSTYLNDTWTWDGTNWTEHSSLNKPSKRWGATMAYDRKINKTILFGGISEDHVALKDTWIWDGEQWLQNFPASSPRERLLASMDFNPYLGHVQLFGGISGENDQIPELFNNDTWIWTRERMLFDGFYPPIDNLPKLNIVKAGQVVPIVWMITDQSGSPISDPGSFSNISSYAVSCDSFNGDLLNAIEEMPVGSSGLQYLGNGIWQFNWKTSKSYAGQCRIMQLTLDDGGKYTANFRFK